MKLHIPVAALALTALGVLLKYLRIGEPYPAEPLYVYGSAVLLTSLISIAMGKAVYLHYLRLLYWLLPITVIIFFLSPEESNPWLPLVYIEREGVMWETAIVLVVVSLTTTIWKAVRLRKAVAKG